MRSALITGITGQDGSYLAELLLEKGYRVHGLVRRTSTPSTTRIDALRDRLVLIPGDVTDPGSLVDAVVRSAPDEVYHLAAQSFVAASWAQPIATTAITGTSAAHLLEAVRRHAPEARYYQASSSEMFGVAPHTPQHERTPLHPRSPYGIAKVYAHAMTVHYREAYGLHASCGICFNHESPRRGVEFVTRKITLAAARIRAGLQQTLHLGDLDAARDWGWAPDFVDGMWRMLQQDAPDDYVFATGRTHTVRALVALAFTRAGLRWEDHVQVDPALVRPAEIHALCGDASKARTQLGWAPTVDFEEMIARMVDADLRSVGVG